MPCVTRVERPGNLDSMNGAGETDDPDHPWLVAGAVTAGTIIEGIVIAILAASS